MVVLVVKFTVLSALLETEKMSASVSELQKMIREPFELNLASNLSAPEFVSLTIDPPAKFMV